MISSNLPVIIVGAGPCGLVAALTLQRHGIPFLIVEKATRAKICSNAGSGFELGPTATKILQNRLSLRTHKIMLKYSGVHAQTLGGEVVCDTQLATPPKKSQGVGTDERNKMDNFPFATVNRSELQNLLLDILFPNADLEKGILICGVALESYREDTTNKKVIITLNDGSSLEGCALLGCDGIHSKVRKCLHGKVDDPLNFTNVLAYWAKTPISPGSDLERELNKTQSYKEHGVSFVFGLGTHKCPGALFAVPSNNDLLWGVFIYSEHPPTDTEDLTRRGGGVLTESRKQELVNKFGNHGYSSLLMAILKHTEPAAITEAGIFDRKDLSLPFSSPGKLVAILGDAAHPQTPFLGQGVNMAITDAYILASRIAMGIKENTNEAVPDAISVFDSNNRHDSVKKIVESARSFADISVSSGRFNCWMTRAIFTYIPVSWTLHDFVKYDNSNKNFLQKHDEDHPELQGSSQ